MSSSIVHISEEQGVTGRGWSSIIGIVTAIIGNILISFALNTQRYAHIRLSQERQEAEEKRKNDKSRPKGRGYGTTQAEIAERRAIKNHKGHENDSEASLQHGSNGTTESQPLLSNSERRDQDGDDGKKQGEKSYLKSPWWWLGIALMTVGECGNFLAYGFAPASIVSPLGVVALVSNCLIAPLLLHEPFRKRDGLGVLIAVAGCITVVLSASGSNPKLDQDEIWQLISTWEFKTYFGVTVFLIVVLLAASNKYGDKSILIDLGLVGLFGGYTALSTKGVASLLSNKIWRVITFPITYLLVAVLVFTAVMQIKYVNRALYRFDSTQVIPVQFVIFTLSVIIGSAILYRDFERKSAEDAIKFTGGCLLTFLGVWCITSGRSKSNDSDEESGSGADDQISLIDEEGVLPEIREDDEEESPIRPTPPRMKSSQSDTPMFKLTQYDSAEPSPMTEAPMPLIDQPAISAAIHDDRAELPMTPSPKRPRQKPPMHATTSEPTLPTTANPYQPSTAPNSPLRDRRSQDHLRTADSPALDPATASTPRYGSLTRASIASMIGGPPAPLTNPLSYSLSAIVADSLRRGVDAPSQRRTLRSKRSRQLARHVSNIEGGEAGRSEVERPPGRGRSLSSTIGDLLRSGRRGRRSTGGEEREGDAV
ncbi:hypothetical protein MBLNU457_g0803t2 [Dothideomycetes sp. NU457]